MQKYFGNATDATGRAINGASILVTKASDNTNAAIFSNNGTTTKANPIVTGADGEYYFYAANGRYNLAVSAPGFNTDLVLDILLYDPADAPVVGGGGTGDVTLNGVQTLTNKTLTSPVIVNPVFKTQTLTDGASVAWDASLGQTALLTVNATGRTLQVPTNLKSGIYSLKVTLGGAGFTYTFGAGYIFTAAPTISTTNGAIDTYLFYSDGVSLYGTQLTRSTTAPPPPPAAAPTAVGTNLSGMEWAQHRYGQSTRQNYNWTPARVPDLAYLASQGMTKVRLPISWEMIQPVLFDSPANATTLAMFPVTNPGDLYAPYAAIIDGIMAAANANGMTVLLDLHNYFRYRDFLYNMDGTVTGIVDPSDVRLMPYSSSVRDRIASKTVAGDLPAATYYYKVSATNASGETLPSAEVSQVTTGANSKVTLTWGAIAGATGYRIYRGATAGGENLYYTVGAVTTFDDRGTKYTSGTPSATNTATIPAPVQSAPSTATTGGTLAAATYYYKVTALTAAGETIGSNELSQVTTGTTSTVTINWAAVAGATGYRIYRGTAAAGENVYYAVGAVVTFTDTGAASTAGTVPGANTAAIVTPTASAPTTTAYAGATLTSDHYVNVWQKLATRYKNMAGFGGYGLMNEPNNMPPVGGTTQGGPEDATITSFYHKLAMDAIRAIDATGKIYVSGNNYDFAATIGDLNVNPGFPIAAYASDANVVYEVHMYLDANNNGNMFDYDIEVAKNQSAGLQPYNQPIGPLTGYNRLKLAIDWAAAQTPPIKLALGEVGMPVDDVRWQTMFKNASDYAYAQGCEIYTWMGGNHWAARNYAINHVPGHYQGRTLHPLVQAPLRAAKNLNTVDVYDVGEGFSAGGAPVTIYVFARGNLAAPVTVNVFSNNGGTFSKASLTLAAGVNSFDSFTFTPASNVVTTISYTRPDGGQVPPTRKVYSLTDPVAYATTSLPDAANAILAKYKAARFLASNAYTDHLNGTAATAAAQVVRALDDSGWGSSFGNIHDMVNWLNTESYVQTENIVIPKLGIANTKPYLDFDTANTFGFWCKKMVPNVNGANTQPNPKDRPLYDLTDSFFQIVTCAVNNQFVNGVAIESAKTEASTHARIKFANAVPRMEFIDGANVNTVITSSGGALANNVANVIAMTSAPGNQKLYVNKVQTGSAALTMTADYFNSHLIGYGYHDYYPQESLQGRIWGAVFGKGAITVPELGVLSDYMATLA